MQFPIGRYKGFQAFESRGATMKMVIVDTDSQVNKAVLKWLTISRLRSEYLPVGGMLINEKALNLQKKAKHRKAKLKRKTINKK